MVGQSLILKIYKKYLFPRAFPSLYVLETVSITKEVGSLVLSPSVRTNVRTGVVDTVVLLRWAGKTRKRFGYFIPIFTTWLERSNNL